MFVRLFCIIWYTRLEWLI